LSIAVQSANRDKSFKGLGAILTQAQYDAGALWCAAVARRPLAMQNFHLPWRNGSHAGPVPGQREATDAPGSG
jgi:hypothetical protein